jgi:hypothetical protein
LNAKVVAIGTENGIDNERVGASPMTAIRDNANECRTSKSGHYWIVPAECIGEFDDGL